MSQKAFPSLQQKVYGWPLLTKGAQFDGRYAQVIIVPRFNGNMAVEFFIVNRYLEPPQMVLIKRKDFEELFGNSEFGSDIDAVFETNSANRFKKVKAGFHFNFIDLPNGKRKIQISPNIALPSGDKPNGMVFVRLNRDQWQQLYKDGRDILEGLTPLAVKQAVDTEQSFLECAMADTAAPAISYTSQDESNHQNGMQQAMANMLNLVGQGLIANAIG